MAFRRSVLVAIGITAALAGCKLDETIAGAPRDAALYGGGGDGGPPGDGGGADAATPCTPGADGDGDGVEDCDEAGDGDPFTDPAAFNGFHAAIVHHSEWSGSCDALDDKAELDSRFATPAQEQDVWAGWSFDTSADDYSDPSFGFMPNWPTGHSGQFGVRFSGRIRLPEGHHCFGVDIGATGTDIGGGRNGCGQIWLDASASSDTALAETGFSAPSVEAAIGCAELAAGEYDLDVVYWYFNIFEQAKLQVRTCSGTADCTPSTPIAAAMVQAAP